MTRSPSAVTEIGSISIPFGPTLVSWHTNDLITPMTAAIAGLSLNEAAYMDGASQFYTFRRVILPIARPGIIVVAIVTFIGAYSQQFIFALAFNSKTEYMPLPIGLYAFFGKQDVIWNELMVASFVGILPALVLIFFLQRYLVGGLTAGAVKQ